jgi:hypothetical protein
MTTDQPHDAQESHDEPSRLLSAVRAVAISPASARKKVENYASQARKALPNASEAEIQDLVADKLIHHYAKLAGGVGGATGLVGIIPGLGTVAGAIGGAFGDTVASMKFQADMAMCLAHNYGYDLTDDDARNLALMIAAGGVLEKAGANAGTRLATKAGVNLLRQYLRGAALQALKELFKKVGLVFTRKALEKALPFGIGAALGLTANYYLTLYVGKQAVDWFYLDRELGGPAATLGQG